MDFDPVEGREQAGRRPALILSVDVFNASPAELVTVMPITSKARALRTRIEVLPPEGGLSLASYVIAEQVRTVSTRRLAKSPRREPAVHPAPAPDRHATVRAPDGHDPGDAGGTGLGAAPGSAVRALALGRHDAAPALGGEALEQGPFVEAFRHVQVYAWPPLDARAHTPD